jgi:hypothetical protein
MQIKKIYLQSTWTKEKYKTQKTDHAFVWKNVWKKVELSHDDPGTIDIPMNTYTQNDDSVAGLISMSIAVLGTTWAP